MVTQEISFCDSDTQEPGPEEQKRVYMFVSTQCVLGNEDSSPLIQNLNLKKSNDQLAC